MSAVAANFVLFQAGWFVSVLGGAGQWHWAGPVFVIVIATRHLLNAANARAELLLLILAGAIGFAWDSALVAWGILQFQTGLLHENLAPLWILAMWVLFATTLNVSLRWLKKRLALAALLGFLGGPLAYFGGAKLGAVVIGDQVLAAVFLAMGWLILLPVLTVLSNHLDGYKQHVEQIGES